jgi:putative membrane protein
MRKIPVLAAIALVGAVGAARADQPPRGVPAEPHIRNARHADAPEHRTTLAGPDRKFVELAASDNESQMALGKLALERATSPAVREYARMLVEDHTRSVGRLKSIANGASFPIPTSALPEQEEELRKLSRVPSEDFDRKFMDRMIKDHEKAIDTFQKAVAGLDSDELRQYALDALPKLREHLDLARGARDGLRR